MPDLTTLTAVKNWQGALAGTNTTADALLAQLITATSADFLREIQRVDLFQGVYSESRIGDGSPRLIVRHWPLQSINSLKIGGVTVPEQTAGTSGWYIDTDADAERRYVLYLSQGSNFTDSALVQIDYIAGYPTTPQDIQQAVTEWVVYRYAKKPSTGQTQSRGVEGERTEFEEEAIPPNTQRVIQRYQREYPKYGKATAAGAAPPQNDGNAPAPRKGGK